MLSGQTGDKAQMHVHVAVGALAGMKRSGAVRKKRMCMEKVCPECHGEREQNQKGQMGSDIQGLCAFFLREGPWGGRFLAAMSPEPIKEEGVERQRNRQRQHMCP